jgi:hypothetical protein
MNEFTKVPGAAKLQAADGGGSSVGFTYRLD